MVGNGGDGGGKSETITTKTTHNTIFF